MQKSLVQRFLVSIAWTSAANWGIIAISLVQSILFARILEIETFGIFAFAYSIVAIAAAFGKFGSGGAFIYRSKHTENELEAAATLFSFKLILVALMATLLLVGTFLFAHEPNLRLALIVLTLSSSFNILFLHIPELILKRRVVHRRLSSIELIASLAAVIVSISWVLVQPTIWALLIGDLVKRAVFFAGFYLWRPIWKPQVKWHKETLKYYFTIGGKNFSATSLLTLIDRVDDLWVGTLFGSAALGIYSRAYRFATYPRQLIASAINKVLLGTYAELTEDKSQLTKAFFRVNAFLIRTGFFLGGLLSLIAPEFISIVLTDKWLPMLPVFRVMLVFTLLDPLKDSISRVFIAIGQPGVVFRARLIQISVLVLGLALFYRFTDFTTIGVAISVNLMLLTGITVLLYKIRSLLQFSLPQLFLAPSIALASSYAVSWLLISNLSTPNIVGTAIVKTLSFVIVYAGVLFLIEGRTIIKQITQSRQMAKTDQPDSESPQLETETL